MNTNGSKIMIKGVDYQFIKIIFKFNRTLTLALKGLVHFSKNFC